MNLEEALRGFRLKIINFSESGRRERSDWQRNRQEFAGIVRALGQVGCVRNALERVYMSS